MMDRFVHFYTVYRFLFGLMGYRSYFMLSIYGSVCHGECRL